MRWVDALKEWNGTKSGTWCIPRKGSEQYKEVRAIMDKSKEKAKKIDEAPAPVKEAKKPSTWELPHLAGNNTKGMSELRQQLEKDRLAMLAKKRGPKVAKKKTAPDFEVEVESPKKMSLVEQERAEARQRQAVRDFFAKKK